MKRFTALLLSMVMVLSMVSTASAGGYTINTESLYPVLLEGSEEVTIRLVVQTADTDGPAEDMWLFKWLENVSGVNIEVTGITQSQWEARKNLILSGVEEMGDVYWNFSWTAEEMYKYGTEGLFLPVQDYIAAYGSEINYINETLLDGGLLKQATCPDGNIYGLPAMSTGRPTIVNNVPYCFSINTTMMEAIGAEIKEFYTIEELYDLAVKVGEAGMNNKITGYYGTQFKSAFLAGYHLIGAFNGNANLGIKYNVDGTKEPVFAATDPAYKEWLTNMNKFWEAGMLDESIFTWTNTEVAASMQENPSFILMGDYGSMIGNNFPEIYEQYKPILINQYPESTAVAYGAPDVKLGCFVITNKCENPDVAVAVANLMYEPLNMIMLTNGPYIHSELQYDDLAKELGIGYDIYLDDNGYFSSYNSEASLIGWDDSKYASYAQYRGAVVAPTYADNLYPINGLYARMKVFNALVHNTGNAGATNTYRTKQIESGLTALLVDPLPHIYLSTEDTETVEMIGPEINDYVAANEGLFITGELNLTSDFDAFIAALEGMGVNEYMDIYNTGYDAVK